MTFSFLPASSGGWLAFVSGPRLLLVATSDDVRAVWASLSSPDGFQASLDTLTSKGLAATPPFVLIEQEPGGAARIVVRGETTIDVSDASGVQKLSAEGVSTWVERSMAGVTALSFSVPGAAPAGVDELPLESGVALVAAISSSGVVSLAPPTAVPSPAPPAVEPVVTPVEPPAAPTEDVEATVTELPEPAAPVDAPAKGADAPTTETPITAPEADGVSGDTMFRDPPAGGEPEPVIDDALHDGETVMTSDISKLRGKRRPNATEAPRPAAAEQLVLVLPGGAREPMNQSILIGRNPSVSKMSGGQIPRLITVGTADQDISRNHAQFVLEGGTVVVTDLHSRNGTSIALPGRSPQRLRGGEPTTVLVGTLVDLGNGITITLLEE